jgi:hypothetical protein
MGRILAFAESCTAIQLTAAGPAADILFLKSFELRL